MDGVEKTFPSGKLQYFQPNKATYIYIKYTLSASII